MYIAASALRISSSASVAFPGSATEMPRLARIDQVVVVELEWAAERVEDALGGLDRDLRIVDVLEQDRELVAAEARGGVGGADARRHALGHLEQDPVAGRVAEAVVDGLEVVEVDEQHGHPDAVAQRPRDRVADALVEQRPVGQVGDRIVEGLVGELLLERLALARRRGR